MLEPIIKSSKEEIARLQSTAENGFSLVSEAVRGGAQSALVQSYNTGVEIANSVSLSLFHGDLGLKESSALNLNSQSGTPQAQAYGIGEQAGGVLPFLAMGAIALVPGGRLLGRAVEEAKELGPAIERSLMKTLPAPVWKQGELALGELPPLTKHEALHRKKAWWEEKEPAQAKPPAQDMPQAIALAKEARALREQGRAQQANTLARQAAKLVGLEGTNPAQSLKQLLGPSEDWRYADNRDFGRAANNALKTLQIAYGLDHPIMIDTLEQATNPKSLLSKALEPFFGKLIESRKAQYGERHELVAVAMTRMADYHAYHGRYAQSLSGYEHAARLHESSLEGNNVSAALVWTKYAKNAEHGHLLSESEQSYRRALGLMENNPHIHASDHAEALNGLAKTLIESGRRGEAEPLLLDAMSLEATASVNRELSHSTVSLLGRIKLHDGKIDQGIDLYQRASRFRPELYSYLTSNPDPGVIIKDEFTATSNPYLHVFNRLKQHGLDDNRGLRWGVVNKYSWWVPNDEAMEALAKEGKLFYPGVGSGYDVAMMRARGIDVVAVDKNPIESGRSYYHSAGKSWTDIIEGDESEISQYPGRTLMLAWPPEREVLTRKPHSMAYNALRSYKGNRLIYIGDDDVTGDRRFRDLLYRDWELIDTIDIPQWSGIRDYFSIYERKQPLLQFHKPTGA